MYITGSVLSVLLYAGLHVTYISVEIWVSGNKQITISTKFINPHPNFRQIYTFSHISAKFTFFAKLTYFSSLYFAY